MHDDVMCALIGISLAVGTLATIAFGLSVSSSDSDLVSGCPPFVVNLLDRDYTISMHAKCIPYRRKFW